MNKSESGKLGWLKSKDKIQAQQKSKRLEYEVNPKTCGLYKSPIPYDKRRNDFCSHSCAAIVHNSNRFGIIAETVLEHRV